MPSCVSDTPPSSLFDRPPDTLPVTAPAGLPDGPNLITIVTDDQGRWAMGAYGNREIRTPSMDRIAREGAIFTNAIVATPVCSPSRATWLTGRYPTELGITDWISPDESRSGLGLKGSTWPKVLQRRGYRTALVGKWHLGMQPQFHPTKLGFDWFYGFLGGGNRPMNPTLEVDGKQTKLKGPLPDLLTNAAITWLKQNKDKPFALSLHFRAPHLPYGPVPKTDSAPYAKLAPTVPKLSGLNQQQLKRRTRNYYASITSIDRNIGRLLDALDELELSNDTIVLFTSDHGYNEGRHRINTKGNGQWMAGGVTGPKRPNMWETSITVPLAVRWPGIVKPSMKIVEQVSNIDLFRTVLGMLDVPTPKDCKARGVDFAPLLRGVPMPPRKTLFGQYDLHNYGLAYLRMARTRRYKLVQHFHARGMDELYDLIEDPSETRNLLRRAPKGFDRSIAVGLRQELRTWMESITDPLLTDPY